MGNWVISILQAGLDFFCTRITGLYNLLIVDPKTYRNGVLWDETMKIFMALLGIGFTIIMISGYLGIIGQLDTIYMARKPEVLFQIFGLVTIAGGIMTVTPDLLLIIIHFCQKILKVIGEKTFGSGLFLEVPGYVINATTGMGALDTLLAFCVIFLLVILIGVTSIGILVMAYGRIFKLYIYIAISPLTLPWMSSKSTQSVAINYIKTFIVSAAEGIIILIAVAVFAIFINADPNSTKIPDVTDKTGIEDTIPSAIPGGSVSFEKEEEEEESPLGVLVSYVLESGLYFSILLSVIKTSETEFKKVFGI